MQLVTADRHIAPINLNDLLCIFVNLSQKVNAVMGYVTSRTSFSTYWNSGSNQKAECVLNFLIQNTDRHILLPSFASSVTWHVHEENTNILSKKLSIFSILFYYILISEDSKQHHLMLLGDL
jgi:hypothetical protein